MGYNDPITPHRRQVKVGESGTIDISSSVNLLTLSARERKFVEDLLVLIEKFETPTPAELIAGQAP